MENCMIDEPVSLCDLAPEEPTDDEQLDLFTTVAIDIPGGYLYQAADAYEVEILSEDLDLDGEVRHAA